MSSKVAQTKGDDLSHPAKTFRKYFKKLQSAGIQWQSKTDPINWLEHSLSSLGCMLSIGFMALLSTHYGVPLMIPSFGASVILIYTAYHVPMAQPRNVLGGHFISAFAGVLIYQLYSNDWWAIALAVALAMSLMTLTGTIHPPGGATAFIAVYSGQNFSFLFAPVAIGSIILISIALLINNLSSIRKYPQYWL
ncbi:MAG: HPP family protein [Desulfotomaculaceae bacterium]|nr:HPP family protein [Desulfotomaculaceae bacterium]